MTKQVTNIKWKSNDLTFRDLDVGDFFRLVDCDRVYLKVRRVEKICTEHLMLEVATGTIHQRPGDSKKVVKLTDVEIKIPLEKPSVYK